MHKKREMVQAAARMAAEGIRVFSNYPNIGEPLPDFEAIRKEVSSTKLDFRLRKLVGRRAGNEWPYGKQF